MPAPPRPPRPIPLPGAAGSVARGRTDVYITTRRRPRRGCCAAAPTEIAAFGKLNREFNDRDAVVYGASTDSEFVHLAWRRQHPDLKNLPFPMLADIKRELSSAFGILDRKEGVALRATFIVDPEGVIRFVSVHDLSVGRNVEEVLRTLDALQSDELCPCNWQKGDEFLKAA